jgi:nucleotide-binding universal stress UspA family protein
MFPLRSVLVAVDFSDQSRLALGLGARLARQTGAALHVLYVERPLLVAAASQNGIDLLVENREELQRFIATAPPAATCAPRLDIVAGDEPGAAILHLANREQADLVVIGARGMSGAGRLLFGSVAEAVLLGADRPVLVVPDSWAPPAGSGETLAGVGPIVVGIDFTESSLLAARAACRLAEQLQTSVEALHVVPELSVLERWKPHAERALVERADLARRDLAERLSAIDSPVRVTTRVERGNVAECLAEAAAPIGTRHPLLVLGRRSPRAEGGTPGATAYRVVSSARVPVLMYRERAR